MYVDQFRSCGSNLMLRIVFQAEKGHRQSFIYIFRTIFRCKVALHVFFPYLFLYCGVVGKEQIIQNKWTFIPIIAISPPLILNIHSSYIHPLTHVKSLDNPFLFLHLIAIRHASPQRTRFISLPSIQSVIQPLNIYSPTAPITRTRQEINDEL